MFIGKGIVSCGMKTLQLLKDYASTTENTWLSKQLEKLEKEILDND